MCLKINITTESSAINPNMPWVFSMFIAATILSVPVYAIYAINADRIDVHTFAKKYFFKERLVFLIISFTCICTDIPDQLSAPAVRESFNAFDIGADAVCFIPFVISSME